MKNPATGELRPVKVGWSWVLFLFASFMGIPLFLRKLYLLGCLMVAWNLLGMLTTPSEASRPEMAMFFVLQLVMQLGVLVWLGLKGNEYTAKNYLERGWVFVHPDAIETQYALKVWQIELPSATAPLTGTGR